jgi:RNA polymerase sigma-70 factor (ECF subfamily)
LKADAKPRPRERTEMRLHFLVLRCQAGDERAFGALLEWFGERTLTYLEGLIGRDDAEDVHQEVWLSVYRGIRALHNPRAFRTWLFRTTRHHAIDFLRRCKREQRLLELAAVEARVSEQEMQQQDVSIDPDIVLDAVLSELSPAHREVMLLRFRDDLSYAEIAMVVGCPVGTVRTRLHHAKRKIYQLLR